jgi:hypothetical protein
MKVKALAVTASLATVLLCDAGWAQQASGTERKH